MKYTVIAESLQGTICATPSKITCFKPHTFDDDGHVLDPDIGQTLTRKNLKTAEVYWSFTRKEWEDLNKKFNKLKKNKFKKNKNQ